MASDDRQQRSRAGSAKVLNNGANPSAPPGSSDPQSRLTASKRERAAVNGVSASAAVLLLSSAFGYPLSTTHVAIGSIIGSGGLYSLSLGPNRARAATAGADGGDSDVLVGGSAAGMVLAALAFLIILAAVGRRIYEIYQIGHPPRRPGSDREVRKSTR